MRAEGKTKASRDRYSIVVLPPGCLAGWLAVAVSELLVSLLPLSGQVAGLPHRVAGLSRRAESQDAGLRAGPST